MLDYSRAESRPPLIAVSNLKDYSEDLIKYHIQDKMIVRCLHALLTSLIFLRPWSSRRSLKAILTLSLWSFANILQR